VSTMSDELIGILLRSTRELDGDKVRMILDEYIDYLKEMDSFYNIEGRLLSIEKPDKLIVFGDIHGDIESLVTLLSRSRFRDTLEGGGNLIFLGDYIDRGRYQVETIMLLIQLNMMYRDRVVLLRGNHEPPRWLPPYPHDFPYHLRARYPDNWREIYEKFLDIFEHLPLAIVAGSSIFMVHGGISVKELNLRSYGRPSREVLTELLWSDPYQGEGYRPSYRGAGYLWGRDITDRFLYENNLNMIIRGHTPCNGHAYTHNNKVLTLFSRLGEPYMNTVASVAYISFSEFRDWRDIRIINITEADLPKV